MRFGVAAGSVSRFAEPAPAFLVMMDIEINKLNKIVSDKDKEIADLLVLIDTLQTNLRSAVSQVDPDKAKSITEVQSFKWCLNWRKE